MFHRRGHYGGYTDSYTDFYTESLFTCLIRFIYLIIKRISKSREIWNEIIWTTATEGPVLRGFFLTKSWRPNNVCKAFRKRISAGD